MGFVEFLGHIILLMSEKRTAMQSSQNWKDLVIYQKLLFRFVFFRNLIEEGGKKGSIIWKNIILC